MSLAPTPGFSFQDGIKKASTSFFSVASPLEIDSDVIKKHDVVLTSLGQFVEFTNEKLQRIELIGIKTAQEVLVHHEFNPPEKFVVILDSENKCSILNYNNLEVVSSTEFVSSIKSDDPEEKGFATLKLTFLDGSNKCLSREDFNQTPEIEHPGTKEASSALETKLRDCKLLCYATLKEKKTKEVFISRQLKNFKQSLQTENLDAEKVSCTSKKYMSGGLNDSSVRSTQSSRQPNNSEKLIEGQIVQICSVRQRIAHEQWVICVTILNVSDRFLVCDPMISLCLRDGASSMTYRCCSLRSVQRHHRTSSQRDTSGVTLETPVPNILKPQKKVSLFAISCLPSFSNGLEQRVNGMVTFSLKSIKLETDDESSFNECQKMVPIPPLSLTASMLPGLCVNPRNEAANAVSLDLVCLIAVSVKHTIKFESLFIPIESLESIFKRHKFAYSVPDISRHYYCSSSINELLHNVVFSFRSIDANSFEMTTYTKNDQQAVLFVAMLLPLLPPDTQVSEPQPMGEGTQTERKFMEAVEKCFEILIDGNENEISEEASTSNKRKMNREECNRKNWKASLYETRWKMDQIYLKMNPPRTVMQ